jgi:hypothetical protein
VMGSHSSSRNSLLPSACCSLCWAMNGDNRRPGWWPHGSVQPIGSLHSPSFAHSAITMARSLSDTFSGISPTDVPAFVDAQLAGALVAVGVARLLFTRLFAHPE